MIQTPRTAQPSTGLAPYAVLGAAWLVAGLAILAATVIAGGAPHTHVVEWPYAAIRSVSAEHGRVLPWRWVGSSAVRSPRVFWASLVAVITPLAVGSLFALTALRGGIPAVFPSLARPQPRQYPRWAGGRRLAAAGLVVSASTRRRRWGRSPRLALGRHRRRWVAAPEGVSVLAIGPAGSGKTAGLCVPAIEEWDGCVAAMSSRTDLLELAAGVRQLRGRVHVLDPGQRTGMGTCTWTPSPPRLSFDDVVRLVASLAGGDVEIDESTRQVVTSALYAAANLGLGVEAAAAWLDDISGATLTGVLLQVEGRDSRAVSWLMRVLERGRDRRAACFSASRELLRTRFERAGGAALSTLPALRPADFLAAGDDTLFVIAPPDLEGTCRLVGSLVRALVAEAERGASRRPLLLVLDGLAAAHEALGQHLARRHGSVTLLATSREVGELDVDRAIAVLYLGGGDRPAMADAAGVVDEWDLPPRDAARRLGFGRALLQYRGVAPAVLWTRSCYEDAELVHRQVSSPFVRGVTTVRDVM